MKISICLQASLLRTDLTSLIYQMSLQRGISKIFHAAPFLCVWVSRSNMQKVPRLLWGELSWSSCHSSSFWKASFLTTFHISTVNTWHNSQPLSPCLSSMLMRQSMKTVSQYSEPMRNGSLRLCWSWFTAGDAGHRWSTYTCWTCSTWPDECPYTSNSKWSYERHESCICWGSANKSSFCWR